jgi:FtsH-binding integral membrane protein
MSTFGYAALTTSREQAVHTSTPQSPPGVGTYVDALAALVPAEVLALHAVILSVTTKTDKATTQIIAPETLFWAFFGLIILSVLLYVTMRLQAGKWDSLDYLRMAIPPLAFVGWTMLQRATAFDAVCTSLAEAPRTALALFLSVLLGLAAANLAYKAGQKKR